MMDVILILLVGAVAFWWLYGRGGDEPKTPMTNAEALQEIHKLSTQCEICLWLKYAGVVAVLTIVFGAALTPAIGLLAATVAATLLFWPKPR